jgi:hypothetical protein
MAVVVDAGEALVDRAKGVPLGEAGHQHIDERPETDQQDDDGGASSSQPVVCDRIAPFTKEKGAGAADRPGQAQGWLTIRIIACGNPA